MSAARAVVLAAGLSSRMGTLKPLLELDGVPAVVRAANAFRDAGVEPLIVTGFAAARVNPVLERAGLHSVVNTDYERGMYCSLVAGLRALPSDVGSFFVQPADCPLVRGETVGRLLRAALELDVDALHPVHEGERGHPPLISSRLVPSLLAGEPPGGLAGRLAGLESSAEIDVDDPGVVMDMDDDEGYERLRRHVRGEGLPDAAACDDLLRRHKAPQQVVAHSRVVRRVALRLADELGAAGLGLHRTLLEAAALTHDIARSRPDHAAAGAEVLAAEGYPRVAAVVRSHMALATPVPRFPGEAEVLYLADKLVFGDGVVPLQARLDRALARFVGDRAAHTAARARLEAAMLLAARVEDMVGRPLDKILS